MTFSPGVEGKKVEYCSAFQTGKEISTGWKSEFQICHSGQLAPVALRHDKQNIVYTGFLHTQLGTKHTASHYCTYKMIQQKMDSIWSPQDKMFLNFPVSSCSNLPLLPDLSSHFFHIPFLFNVHVSDAYVHDGRPKLSFNPIFTSTLKFLLFPTTHWCISPCNALPLISLFMLPLLLNLNCTLIYCNLHVSWAYTVSSPQDTVWWRTKHQCCSVQLWFFR